jgi:hypothetical protein
LINRDPRCVYVANSVGEADIIANWLAGNGVPTQVMDRSTLGGLDGLTPWSPLGIAAKGIEVWILDPRDAARTLLLLEQHQADRDAQAEANRNAGPVSAECEGCGEITVFPAKQRGTVQDCPYCGSYIDVGDDGPDPVDVSEDES